ncbi:MAG: VPLPA-CTERM sorting domain-containing protein, partial [Gammaproteobacteria bacterium]
DLDPSVGGGYIHEMSLDTSNNNIQFSADAFDGAGTGAGSSALSVDPLAMTIGAGLFFGLPITFYIDGGGPGILNDIDGTQGDWTINVPLFADWNGNTFEYTGFSLSSDATYQYESLSGSATAIGQAMDYLTGDVFLVGQGVNLDLSSGVYGTRITLGINGNDPVVVPAPAAVWLFGSGLIGLVGMARRKRSV